MVNKQPTLAATKRAPAPCAIERVLEGGTWCLGRWGVDFLVLCFDFVKPYCLDVRVCVGVRSNARSEGCSPSPPDVPPPAGAQDNSALWTSTALLCCCVLLLVPTTKVLGYRGFPRGHGRAQTVSAYFRRWLRRSLREGSQLGTARHSSPCRPLGWRADRCSIQRPPRL